MIVRDKVKVQGESVSPIQIQLNYQNTNRQRATGINFNEED